MYVNVIIMPILMNVYECMCAQHKGMYILMYICDIHAVAISGDKIIYSSCTGFVFQYY